MQFINQYSYVVISVFFLLVSGAAVYFWLPDPGGILLVVLVGVIFVAVGAALRFPAGDSISDEALAAQLQRGVPTLIVVYSNY